MTSESPETGERTMRKHLSWISACVFVATAFGFADSTEAQTTVFDTVHIRVTDTAKAVQWYIKFLGASGGFTPSEVLFGDTHVQFLKADEPNPSAGGVIDHIGVSYSNVDAKVRVLESGGVKVLTPIHDYPGLFKVAFVEDPWGTKIEIVEDPELLGFHHVHLRVQNPSESLAWFQRNFVGQRSKLKGQIDGLRLGNGWLLAMDSGKEVPARSTGRAIENLALRVPNVDKATEMFRSMGIKILTEPSPYKDLRYAYIEDPTGVKVGLIERPKQ
jgi:catechol 2,3-dioxygenase-like lactoylglutathione lyase family enzyme